MIEKRYGNRAISSALRRELRSIGNNTKIPIR